MMGSMRPVKSSAAPGASLRVRCSSEAVKLCVSGGGGLPVVT